MFDVGQIIDINRGQGHSGVSGQLGVDWVSVCNKQTNNSENVFSDNVLTTPTFNCVTPRQDTSLLTVSAATWYVYVWAALEFKCEIESLDYWQFKLLNAVKPRSAGRERQPPVRQKDMRKLPADNCDTVLINASSNDDYMSI